MFHQREKLREMAYGIRVSRLRRVDAFKMKDDGFGSGKGLPARLPEDAAADRGGAWLRCAHCRSAVARTVDWISVNGRRSHVFNNPAGYVFEIGCFSEAKGCIHQGSFTSEFTWFAGFSWCFALCGNCHCHLGWYYRSMTKERFYGLILANLVEDPSDVSSKGN